MKPASEKKGYNLNKEVKLAKRTFKAAPPHSFMAVGSGVATFVPALPYRWEMSVVAG